MKNKNYTTEVVYICDGKVPRCSHHEGCYYKKTKGTKGPCMHTHDVKHAKYGAVDPKKHPERFEKFKAGNVVRYYEKFGKDD